MNRFLSKTHFIMTMGVCLLTCVLFAPSISHAQASEPGWFNVTANAKTNSVLKLPATSGLSSSKMAQVGGKGIVPLQTIASGFGATEATPAITELARGLRNDPLLIYAYVHDHVDFEPYYGSLKGATGAYLDGSGNDFDQASLMIALLRVGGYTAQYAYGTVTIAATNAENWLGVDNYMDDVAALFADGGMPPLDYTDSDITLQHVWVAVTVGANVYLFDPSYKQYQNSNGIDLAGAMAYNRGHLFQVATNGATVSTNYIRNLSETGIRNELLSYSTNLVGQLKTNHPNDDVRSIIGGRQIVSDQLQSLPVSLPFAATQSALWDTIPTDYVHQVRIKYGNFDATLNIPELNGGKLSISYQDQVPPPSPPPPAVTLVNESFEDANVFPNNWTVADTNSANGLCYWGRVANNFFGMPSHSGGYLAYCAGNGYYYDGTMCYTRSSMASCMYRTIDLTTSSVAQVSFWSQISNIDNITDSCNVLVDDGVSQTTVWTQSPPGYSGVWLNYNVDLTPFVGKKIRLIFEYLAPANSNPGIGWFLDDIVVTATPRSLVAVLRKDDAILTQEASVSNTTPSTLTLTVTHPYFTSNCNQTVNYPLLRGANYVIVRGFGGACDSGRWLRSRQRQLELYQAQNLASTSQVVVTETLNIIGQTWIDETALASELIDHLAGVRTITHHRFGVMAQETGFYIDIKAQLCSMLSTNGDPANVSAAFAAKGLISSAMEHGVLEQMQGTNLQCASTVKLITLNNRNGNKTFLVKSNNFNAVKGSLLYGASEKVAFSNFVATGGLLLLPETNAIVLNQWNGEGYMQLSPINASGSGSIAMIIGGNYFGGYCGDEVPADPFTTYSSSAPNLADQTMAYHNLSQEPVDLVTGAYLSQNEDLALGGTEPRGLHLVRSYNSSQGNQKSVLGCGWTHSYDMSIQINSDYRSGLGLRTPLDAVPAIVACLATWDLAKNATNALGWTTAILVNQWATDQLANNACNVMLGSKALSYIKLPNGSFSPPPGCTTALTLSNSLYRLTERFGTKYDFGANQHISTWTDVDGNAMSFQYNTATNLYTVSDCFNRQLTFNYTGALLTSVSHSGTPSRSVSYGYSASGDLTTYTDPETYVWKQNYDTLHRIVSLVDPLLQMTITNIYDSVGHVQSQKNGFTNTWNFYFSDYRNVEEDPQGGQKIYTYDEKSRQIGSELVAGHPSFVVYDGQDHPIYTVDAAGNPTWSLFDGNNNLTNTIDALTNRTSFFYDAQYRLKSLSDPMGGVAQYGYDSNHHLTNTVDAAGHVTTSSYFASGTAKGLPNTVVYPGNISVSYTYTNGLVASITRTDGGTSWMQYNTVGNLTAATDPNAKVTRYTFDKRCLPLTVVDALNNTNRNIYSKAGLLTNTIDALGRTNTITYTPTYKVASARLANGGTITNNFDSRDLPIRVTNARGYSISNTFDAAWRKVVVTDPRNNRVSMALDPAGNSITTTNALGFATATTFDPLNRPIAATDPLQRQWSSVIDARGATASATDARGRITHYTTDTLGRRTAITYPSGRTEGFGFDALGNLIAFTNSEGHVYRLGRDGQGRITAATNGANEVVFRNFFDAAGNLTNRLDGAGRPTRNQFDALNRCTNTVYSDGSSEAYTFDAVGNLLTAKNANSTNTFVYSSMNQLTSAVSRMAGMVFTNQYQYDLGGLATNVVYPDGKTVRYFFDPNGNVTNVIDWSNHAWCITRDAGEQITAIAYPGSITGTWGFDASGSVTNWAYISADTNMPGRKITRDVMGLKTREDITSGLTPHPSINRRAVNTFDNADRLTSAQVGTGTNPVIETYRYDGCGALTNIVRSTGTNDYFTYDLAGRVASVTSSNVSMSVSLDAFGNRVKTTVNGTTHLWVIDYADQLKRPLMETTTNGTPVRYYIWGAGRLLGIIESDGTLRCAHCDEKGNILALTDGSSGNVSDTFAYGPYGEDWGRTGTNSIPFRWLGSYGVWRVSDTSTLYLTRHRAYDTTLKRWLSQDPAGIGGGGNLYCYGNCNPLSYTDSQGLWAGVDDAIAVVGGALIGVAAQGVGDLIHGKASSWQHYVAAAVGGAAAGEATLYTGPAGGLITRAAVGGAVGGLIGNATRQDLDIATGKQSDFNYTSLAVETGLGGALGAAGGYVGNYVVPGALKYLSNEAKGNIGEGLSLVDNMMEGRVPVKWQEPVPIPGTTRSSVVDWQFKSPADWDTIIYVESKFGTSGLTDAQRLANKLLDNYEVDRWTYPWLARIGTALGTSVGEGVNSQVLPIK